MKYPSQAKDMKEVRSIRSSIVTISVSNSNQTTKAHIHTDHDIWPSKTLKQDLRGGLNFRRRLSDLVLHALEVSHLNAPVGSTKKETRGCLGPIDYARKAAFPLLMFDCCLSRDQPRTSGV